MRGGEGVVGGCCGLRKGSRDDGGGGDVASCQRRAEIRGKREGFVSFSELPKSGGGGGWEVAVAIFRGLP